jgi:hypothetical protein
MKILAEGDVIDVLLDQHEQIRRTLHEVGTATEEAKAVAFLELETLLYVHETGEQQVVHPFSSTRISPPGLVDDRLREESATDELLRQLRDLDVHSNDFDTTFQALRDVVLAHMSAEENQEFPRLRSAADADQLLAMAEQLRETQDIP